MNIRGETATHGYWTGNLEQTARHREPELSAGKRQDIKILLIKLSPWKVSYISQSTLWKGARPCSFKNQ